MKESRCGAASTLVGALDSSTFFLTTTPAVLDRSMASSSNQPGMPPPATAGMTPRPAPPGLEDTMYFSRESGTWRLETDDGNEMEYDATKNIWVPVVRPLNRV
jgi:hypothetical protein